MTTPKRKTTQELDVRSMARAHTHIAVRALSGIAQNGKTEAARVSAAVALIDRGWGRPHQDNTHEVRGEIKVILRKMLTDDEP